MQSGSSVTMKKIALQAGVSRALVSQILNNNYQEMRIKEETAEKIRKTAMEMGYIPNSAAKAIASGKFNCISLLQSGTEPSRSFLPPELLQGIQETLNARGMHLILSSLTDEKLTSTGFVPKILSELFVDGLLVNYNARIPAEMVSLVRKNSIPSVWINSKQEEDCVYPDDFNAGVQATEHLLELGHKRILYVNFAGYSHYSSYDREEGYKQAMQHAGLKPRSYMKNRRRKETAEIAKTLLDEGQAPTAVICYNYRDFLAFREAAFALGLRLPEDISLITFGTREECQILGVSLSTILLPEKAIGERATEMLIAKIQSPNIKLKPEIIPCKLEIGNTAGIAQGGEA